MNKQQGNPKMELERSVLEMIKAARSLVKSREGDAFWAGTRNETLKRLYNFEKQIYKLRSKSNSELRIREIAKELSLLIGHICKSLIRWIPHSGMKYFVSSFFMRSVNIL